MLPEFQHIARQFRLDFPCRFPGNDILPDIIHPCQFLEEGSEKLIAQVEVAVSINHMGEIKSVFADILLGEVSGDRLRNTSC